MILQVAYEDLIDELRTRLPNERAYVDGQPFGGSVISCGTLEGALIVQAVSASPPGKVTEDLRAAGIEVRKGNWSDGQAQEPSMQFYVAAVAYRSREMKPGLWLDATVQEPTAADVLRKVFDEFRENGELSADISFEEFIRLAHPNVGILKPSDVERFLSAGC